MAAAPPPSVLPRYRRTLFQHGTFKPVVHHRVCENFCGRRRSRSAPSALGPFPLSVFSLFPEEEEDEDGKEVREARSRCSGLVDGAQPSRSCHRPKRKTREDLKEFRSDELCAIAYTYGLGKLRCREDRQIAEGILPAFPAVVRPKKLQRVHGFLEQLSWEELVLLLRGLAQKRKGSDGSNDAENDDAEYLISVCDQFLESQLRDAASWECDSVLTWRLRRVCASRGLGSLCEEVMRRLDCGVTLFVTAKPVPLLDEELQCIKRLVARCRVTSATAAHCELERLASGCDVLYVGGMHDGALQRLHGIQTLNPSLAILNVCRSERLAKHLLAQGVRHVAYWPAAVHDASAVAFGISFVTHLLEMRITDAFVKARAGVCPSERAPRLLSTSLSSGPKRAGLRHPTEVLHAGDVILEQRGSSGRPEFAECTARVLGHTALRCWVRVRVGDGVVISWRVGHWRALGTPSTQAKAPTPEAMGNVEQDGAAAGVGPDVVGAVEDTLLDEDDSSQTDLDDVAEEVNDNNVAPEFRQNGRSAAVEHGSPQETQLDDEDQSQTSFEGAAEDECCITVGISGVSSSVQQAAEHHESLASAAVRISDGGEVISPLLLYTPPIRRADEAEIDFKIKAFAERWGIDSTNRLRLIKLTDEQRLAVLQDFQPPPGTTNVNALLGGFIGAVAKRTGEYDSSGVRRTRAQPSAWAEKEMDSFMTKWGVDEKNLDYLWKLTEQQLIAVLKDFKPPQGTTNVNAQLAAFIRSVVQRVKIQGMSPSDERLALSHTANPLGLGASKSLKTDRPLHSSDQLDIFIQSWGVDHKNEDWLRQLSQPQLAAVLNDFERRPDNTNVNAQLASFIKAVVKRHGSSNSPGLAGQTNRGCMAS